MARWRHGPRWSAGSAKPPHPSASAHRRDATAHVWKMPLIPAVGGGGRRMRRAMASVRQQKGSWRDNLHKFISNLIMNHPGCWRRENTAQPACRRATLHICMSPPSFSPLSPSDLNEKAFCSLSPPTLHGWPHLRKRVRAEKRRGPSVVQTQTSGFYGSLTVLSWLQECVDCVTEVVVLVVVVLVVVVLVGFTSWKSRLPLLVASAALT